MAYEAIIWGMGIISLIFVFMSTNITISEFSEEDLKGDRRRYWSQLGSIGLKILFLSGAIIALIILTNSLTKIAENEGYANLEIMSQNAYYLVVFIFVTFLTITVIMTIYDAYRILKSGVDEG